MFYSHEILTSRKYGVATVWLVATLGARSNTRKVTRKAILDVDVRKACETIVQPAAPMALRLQSNLLYGVSRVYDQQCGYVLSDAQAAQNNMRALLKIVRGNDLDAVAVKARPDQLMIMDDPAFNLDMPLPALDFDFDLAAVAGDSQRSTQSMMSIPRDRSGSISSHAGTFGINLPSSSTHAGAYQLPNAPFGESSAQKGRDIFDDEAELFQDDLIFEFDANGEIRDIGDQEREARRAGSVHPHGNRGSDSAASGRVRKDHEDAAAGRVLFGRDDNGDFDMNFGDEGMPLPDAEAFPMMSGALGGNDRPGLLNAGDHIYSQENSSETAEAPAKKRKAKGPKKLAPDQMTMLFNKQLATWQREYLDNVTAEKLLKLDKKAKAVSKKNAAEFVFGKGLNGVGDGVGSLGITSPLEMFSGAALLAKVTGRIAPSNETKKGTKRAHEDEDDQAVTKRARPLELDDEIGRGNPDDDMAMQIDDFDPAIASSSIGIEHGRDAPSALQDAPSSALMPWNVSQSLHSHQRSSAHPGSQAALSQAGRRMTSASPLVGRGSVLPADLDHLMHDNDDQILYGRSDNEDELGDDAFLRRGHSAAGGPSSSHGGPGADDFELFGPAANVDTQTAGTSQWVKEVMDRESGNFFEYVRNTIEEKAGDELSSEGDGAGVGGEGEGSVTFEELFNPNTNSAVVAAQAFYHVLCLATKGRVWVEQDAGQDDEEVGEPFGEIRIGVAV